jgi:hypothetical protein
MQVSFEGIAGSASVQLSTLQASLPLHVKPKPSIGNVSDLGDQIVN